MCPCSGFTMPSQQPVNCIVRFVDHGVTEKPEFDIVSQSHNLLLKGERKSRGGRGGGRGASLWPQRESLELAWRHLSNSWFGPYLHGGGGRAVFCSSPPPCCSPWLLSTWLQCHKLHTLRGPGWKVSPKDSSLPSASEPGFGWFYIFPHCGV